MALHLANNQLEGALGNRIQQLRDQLTFQLSEFESQLDFPEEELDFQPADQVQESLNSVAMALRQLLETQNEGEVLREGVRLVLAGAPNTGKSSLLNTILGRDRAIVTEIPGTTRDLLEETASIRGIPVKLIDTAGIRESIDLVERTGIERTWQSVATAQLVLWLIDVSRPITEQLPPKHPEGSPILLVANKTDLLAAPLASDALQHNVCDDAALVSIRENDGMDTLFDKIEQLIWHTAHHSEPEIAVNTRHASLLKEALLSVDETIAELESGELELVCIPLRHAIDSLGAITGETVALDILDTIFSRFCIGK
jgi:tRNA modification GTPase